jgi:hypothetical protein
MRLLLLLLVVGLAMIVGAMLLNRFDSVVDAVTPQTHREDNSKVLLEKIQKVYKMIVVEGEFADILDRKEYYGWDLPGLRKRAIVKVKGKVSVGYNLENLRIDLDSTNRTMRIVNLPEPEILAIDTDVNYYDIENGVFNSFSPQELSQLHAAAKDTIRANALRSQMMQTARQQATEMLGLITQIATESGWKVEYVAKSTPAVPKSIETPRPTVNNNNNTAPKTTTPKPSNPTNDSKKYSKEDIEALKKKYNTPTPK